MYNATLTVVDAEGEKSEAFVVVEVVWPVVKPVLLFSSTAPARLDGGNHSIAVTLSVLSPTQEATDWGMADPWTALVPALARFNHSLGWTVVSPLSEYPALSPSSPCGMSSVCWMQVQPVGWYNVSVILQLPAPTVANPQRWLTMSINATFEWIDLYPVVVVTGNNRYGLCIFVDPAVVA